MAKFRLLPGVLRGCCRSWSQQEATSSSPVPSKSHNHLHQRVAVGKNFLRCLLLEWWKPAWTLLRCFLNKHEKGHPGL